MYRMWFAARLDEDGRWIYDTKNEPRSGGVLELPEGEFIRDAGKGTLRVIDKMAANVAEARGRRNPAASPRSTPARQFLTVVHDGDVGYIEEGQLKLNAWMGSSKGSATKAQSGQAEQTERLYRVAEAPGHPDPTTTSDRPGGTDCAATVSGGDTGTS